MEIASLLRMARAPEPDRALRGRLEMISGLTKPAFD
jgi:hypothetical protein